MDRVKRSQIPIEARRLGQELCLKLGRELRASRLRRRLTQAEASERARLSRSTWSRMELGKGAGQTIDAWARATVAVERPIRLDLGADALERPADTGHLDGQELVLRVLRASGVKRFVELNTRPSAGVLAAWAVALVLLVGLLLVTKGVGWDAGTMADSPRPEPGMPLPVTLPMPQPGPGPG